MAGIQDNLQLISKLRAGLIDLEKLYNATKEELRNSKKVNAELINDADKSTALNADLTNKVHRLRR